MAPLLVLGACAAEPKHEYPADVIENFVATCRQRTAERACECAIDRLRDAFSYEQFEVLDGRMAAGELPPEVAKVVADCARR